MILSKSNRVPGYFGCREFAAKRAGPARPLKVEKYDYSGTIVAPRYFRRIKMIAFLAAVERDELEGT
jgi:hypothetical protein